MLWTGQCKHCFLRNLIRLQALQWSSIRFLKQTSFLGVAHVCFFFFFWEFQVRILFHIFFHLPSPTWARERCRAQYPVGLHRSRISNEDRWVGNFSHDFCHDIWIATGTHCMACLTGHWRYLSVKSGTNQGTNQQQTPKSTDNCHQLGDPGLHISI